MLFASYLLCVFNKLVVVIKIRSLIADIDDNLHAWYSLMIIGGCLGVRVGVINTESSVNHILNEVLAFQIILKE